jgi:hypothetical protein
MKRNRHSSRKQEKTVRLWDLDEARKALPYVTSVMRSLRDYHLEWATQDRERRQLAKRPGRPDRSTLIAQEETASRVRQAKERFDATHKELQDIDVFLVDPVRGEAAIPFLREEQLAWYLVDIFADPPLQHWRFHQDDLAERRPIAAVPTAEPAANVWYA